MNRDKTLRTLQRSPKLAGRVGDAVRVGIVRGFFTVKNPKENEEGIRKIYRIPDTWKATWLPDGSVMFAFPGEARVHVTPDGKAVKHEEK